MYGIREIGDQRSLYRKTTSISFEQAAKQDRCYQEWENCKAAVQEWLVTHAHLYEDYASYDLLHSLWTDHISRTRNGEDWREYFAGAGAWLFENILQRGCGSPAHYSILEAASFAENWGRDLRRN